MGAARPHDVAMAGLSVWKSVHTWKPSEGKIAMLAQHLDSGQGSG